MKIAITGGHGFIGRALLDYARNEGIAICAIARENYLSPKAYADADVVIHLAGLAHRKSATYQDYLAINCDLALGCARAAAQAGARRFIFVSSSKVLCDFASDQSPLQETETPNPTCDYGRSKLAAEEKLLVLQLRCALQVVVIRPALVLGAPAKANLRNLALMARVTRKFSILRRFQRRLFAECRERKSFTSLSNLCSALVFVAFAERIESKIFHVVDDQTMSTAELFGKLENAVGPVKEAKEAGRTEDKPGILPLPLKTLLTLLGLAHVYRALARPMVLDGTKIQRELGWKPQPVIDVELQRIMESLPTLDDRPKG